MANNKGLGKGLGALITPKVKTTNLTQEKSSSDQIQYVPVTSIVANPYQPRTQFDQQALEDLTSSIKEHGIIQPLVVTKTGEGYELIAGERRLRASQLLNLSTVPVIVRDVEDQKKLEIALIENVQRKNLNPIEEATSYQRLMDEFSLTQQEVADKVGKSRSVIANTVRLLGLPEEIQKAVSAGKISYSTARVIASLPEDQQMQFFKKALASDLTARAAEGQARNINVKSHKRRSTKDAETVAQEEQLQDALGTKVNIKKSGSSGQIIVDFYSEEELSGLIDKIS